MSGARVHFLMKAEFLENGCIHCRRKDVVYGSGGFCGTCQSRYGQRMRRRYTNRSQHVNVTFIGVIAPVAGFRSLNVTLPLAALNVTLSCGNAFEPESPMLVICTLSSSISYATKGAVVPPTV